MIDYPSRKWLQQIAYYEKVVDTSFEAECDKNLALLMAHSVKSIRLVLVEVDRLFEENVRLRNELLTIRREFMTHVD